MKSGRRPILRSGINGFFADYALEEFSEARFQALLHDPLEIVLVVEKNTLLQGYVRLVLNSQSGLEGYGEAQIKTLYVGPRHHNRGFGKELLRAGLAMLAARGHSTPWLAINAQNKEAMSFYMALGFDRVGKRNFCIGQTRVLNYILSSAGLPAVARQTALDDG